MNIIWTDKSRLITTAMKAMKSARVLLDVGCGIVPQQYLRPAVHICCEPCQEYVQHLKQKLKDEAFRDRDYVLLNMGWDDAVQYFPEKSVDTVILVDVIEHLEKKEGMRLLAATEKIAREQVILFTPLGFMPQHHDDGKDAWGLGGADWQEHKSGWLPEDFCGEEWEFFAAKDFHAIDSNGKLLDKAYGAFWAIKKYRNDKQQTEHDQPDILRKLEIEARERITELQQREDEINQLLSARIERKFRRIISTLR